MRRKHDKQNKNFTRGFEEFINRYSCKNAETCDIIKMLHNTPVFPDNRGEIFVRGPEKDY